MVICSCKQDEPTNISSLINIKIEYILVPVRRGSCE